MKMWVHKDIFEAAKIAFPNDEILICDLMTDENAWVAKIEEAEYNRLFPKANLIEELLNARP